MNQRPRLRVQFDRTDKAIEIIGWTLLVLFWGTILWHLPTLPETIPTHYNSLGEPDSFGNKWTILTLPFIATLIFVGMTVLHHYPHTMNYAMEITDDNAAYQYTIATRLIRHLKVVIVIVFGLIAYQTIRYAHGETVGLGSWFLPVLLTMIFVPIISSLIKSSKK